MLVTIFSSMAFTKRRMMMQIFPPKLQNLWDDWVLRVMVLVSLSFQTFLVLFGNRRKYKKKTWLRFTLWFSYVSADGLATVALGFLSNKVGESKGDSVEAKYVIIGMWAPLLLLHLGGPDTITAYSMEDNELWDRHLLCFVVQVGVAVYIFLRSWTNTDLNILVIPIFIAGLIKIGERIWVLWSASSQQFKESLFPDPDPGPNYARDMEDLMSASNEGFNINVDDLIDDHTPHAAEEGNIILLQEEHVTYGPAIIVEKARSFLKISKLLFADLILSFQDVIESRLFLLNGKSEEVFEVMEIELGFMYDLFYTKAPVIDSFPGLILRSVTLICNMSVLFAFFFIEKNQYPKVDVVITSVLLLGAITLEIYSVIFLFSYWTSIPSFQFVKSSRWSRCIGQFNLIRFCLLKARRKQRWSFLHKIQCVKLGLIKCREGKCPLGRTIIGVWRSCQKFKHCATDTVEPDLKEIIFNHFKDKIVKVGKTVKNEEELAREIAGLSDHRGDNVLESLPKLVWSVKVKFDESILLWHIATDVCYNTVLGEEGSCYRKASKMLSEYMLYLLVMRPSMLPNGIGEIRFQDTCVEATDYIKGRHCITLEKKACEMLLEVSRDSEKFLPSKVKGDKSKSVLFDGCRLAMLIQNIWKDEERETGEMWKLITGVWIEMLAYAASHCQGIHHAQHLRHGGELLSHVWLLMAHLGITDQLQISKGFGRAKLIRS